MLVSSQMSKTKIKEMSGFKSSEMIQFVLIGQLGKFSRINSDGVYEKSKITSKEILDNVYFKKLLI